MCSLRLQAYRWPAVDFWSNYRPEAKGSDHGIAAVMRHARIIECRNIDDRNPMRQRSVLDLAYLSLDGRESRRCVHPLGLTLFDEVWLLTAWCETANDFRNFRLDCIKALSETGMRFRQVPKRRFQDYLASL